MKTTTQTARAAKYSVGSEWLTVSGQRVRVHCHLKTGVTVAGTRIDGSPSLVTIPWTKLDLRLRAMVAR